MLDYFKRFRNSHVAANAGYLLLTQIINYVFPLISLKYLVGVLGVDYFGKISFAQSFIGYFIILVDYGFNISATQKVALSRNNPQQEASIFYSVFFAKGILLICSFVLLLICVIAIPKFSQDASLYITFFGVVFGLMLFPQWFFQGIEKMGYVTLINTIVKVVFLVCIFLLVKRASDYVYVPFLFSCSYILPGIYAFWIAKNKISPFRLPTRKEIMHTFSSGFSVFLSSAMSAVLTGTAIVILGFVSTDAIVGYYAGFDKLIKAAITIFAPITLAIYPTVSRKFSESHAAGYSFVRKTALPTIMLAVVLSSLLIIFSKPITLLFYKSDFLAYRPILYILAIWIAISVSNNFIGIQYLAGSGRATIYGKAFTIAGVLSLLMIYFFTRYFSYIGTAISVLGGEILLSIIMLFFIFHDKKK